MGLKTTNYYITQFDLTVPTAYAVCNHIQSSQSGFTDAEFGIYNSREDAYSDKTPYEHYFIHFEADKTLPLWGQAYTAAKASEKFKDWEDDIPTTEI